jgi:hypothetical protein
MEDRNVIIRRGDGPDGTASFIALLAIAVIIALFILQPWEHTNTQRFMTITTQQH